LRISFTEIKRVYKPLIVLNILLYAFIFYQIFYSKYYWEGNNEKKIIVEQGKNLDEIISLLRQNDVISNSFLFKAAVKLTGKQDQILSKSYLFKSGISNMQLIDMLTDKNLSQFIKFTIPEGYNIRQIGRLLEKKLSKSKDKFYKETENDSLINILGLKGKIKNLEGFLYPDTYEIEPSISERKIVFILFNEFRKKIISSNLIESETGKKDSSLLSVITLASIVQGETNIKEEMPVIAGVYKNRLVKDMKLEADPTIQYFIPDGPKRLLFSDLKIDSPYNTYLNKGLPPGPINNPGIDAVKAALNPENHNYIFFVATGEGGHKFSENYQQHQTAVKEYKSNLKKQKSKRQ
jgi:UPF0755 protein